MWRVHGAWQVDSNGLDHARHPLDRTLLRVPLPHKSGASSAPADDVRCDTRAVKRALRRGPDTRVRVPWWCTRRYESMLSAAGVGQIGASAGLGLLPVHQFGSFLATRVVREAELYGASPYAMHATHIVGSGVIFMRNNLQPMGPCTHPVWCLGAKQVTTAAIKALTHP